MDILLAIRILARKTPVFRFYQSQIQKKLYDEWLKSGGTTPSPHFIKQQAIREYVYRFKPPIFVETGTYLGDMVEAVKDLFSEIYSIELGVELYQQARKRFADIKHIKLYNGDSGEILQDLMKRIKKPCLFWLDSHYSAGITSKGEFETPIQKELSQILIHPMIDNHIILIDDARCFTGRGDYPSIRSLRDLVTPAGLNKFEVKDDIIRIYKQS